MFTHKSEALHLDGNTNRNMENAPEFMQGHNESRLDGMQDRAAGQRSADNSYPEFGPTELVGEINSAEKIVREVDRQLRGQCHRSVVTLQFGSDGPLDERNSNQRAAIRSVQTCFSVSRTNGSSPMANCHAKIVNRAVVDRPRLPYSEEASKFRYYDEHQFQIEEATVVPAKSGISLILHELCCSKPRGKLGRCNNNDPEGIPLNRVSFSDHDYVKPSCVVERVSAKREWDPMRDAHLYVPGKDESRYEISDAHNRMPPPAQAM